ncbi:hypothetical protein GCM10023237_70000 [Streptomyces coeruleoprunus]|uniref:hypothetical protein n=1 Tax=Streptomyces coeruleoprunus TaxID=285563 RepID=UPI0031EE85D2
MERARWLKKQSKMDMVMHVAKEAVKEASGYNDVVDCLNGNVGNLRHDRPGAAVPLRRQGQAAAEGAGQGWSAYRKWEDEVRWATGIVKRPTPDAQAMAKYTEDMADWKKQADAAKAAKKAKADEVEANSGESRQRRRRRRRRRKPRHGDGGAGESLPGEQLHPGDQGPDGRWTTKPIKDVKPGDKVVAKDPKTGETAVKEVTAQIIGKAPRTWSRSPSTRTRQGHKTAKATATTATRSGCRNSASGSRPRTHQVGDVAGDRRGHPRPDHRGQALDPAAAVYNLTVATFTRTMWPRVPPRSSYTTVETWTRRRKSGAHPKSHLDITDNDLIDRAKNDPKTNVASMLHSSPGAGSHHHDVVNSPPDGDHKWAAKATSGDRKEFSLASAHRSAGWPTTPER